MKTITALLLATHLVSIARGEAIKPATPTDVVASFIKEVRALSTNHSELAGFPEYVKQLDVPSQVAFYKNHKPVAVPSDTATPMPTKRRIRPSDCDTNGIVLEFVLEDARQATRQAPLDTITYLPGLGLTLYAEVVLWEKASPELKKQLEDIIGRHKAMLQELDKTTEASKPEDVRMAPPQTIDLEVGTIQLPAGFSERKTGTKDSRRGEITRNNPVLVITYDIGMMSGLHMHPKKKGACLWFKEEMMFGQKCYMGMEQKGTERVLTISIVPPDGQLREPWTYPANFWATVRTDEDIELIKQIALSYSPRADAGIPGKTETDGVMADEHGGTAAYAYTGNLMASHRPQPGDFQGARFPAEEVRHLNKLLAKGVVVEDWKETAERERWTPWESHTLIGSYIYADEPYQVVEIQTLRKPFADSDLFDLKHVVMLRSGQQTGRKVVYNQNPELVTYVQGDFMRKLDEWNPDLEQKRFPGGPFHITPKDAGSLEQDLAITHKVSKVATQLGELTQTAYYRGDSMILKKVVPPDGSLNTVYYVIHNGFEVLTYKTGPAGTEFAEAGIIRDMVKPDYTIKMAGDKEGRIQRITLYSPDFSKTYDSFWLRNNELIPWTAEELAGWRKLRDPGARKNSKKGESK